MPREPPMIPQLPAYCPLCKRQMRWDDTAYYCPGCGNSTYV